MTAITANDRATAIGAELRDRVLTDFLADLPPDDDHRMILKTAAYYALVATEDCAVEPDAAAVTRASELLTVAAYAEIERLENEERARSRAAYAAGDVDRHGDPIPYSRYP